jgi:iron complex transport system substrate-binding protein
MINAKTAAVSIMLGLAPLLMSCTPAPTGTSKRATHDEAPVLTHTALQSTADSLVVVDALGRRLRFQEPPRRIVLPGRAVFITADAILLFPGVGKRIVATGKSGQGAANFISLIDPDLASKAILTEESGPEQIAGFRPDTVILKSYLAPSLGNAVEALGIPVVYVDFETPDQYFRDLQTLGQLLGQRQRAAELIEYYRASVRRVQRNLQGLEEKQKRRVLLLYYSDKDGKVAFGVPPSSWIQTKMTEMAGGIPVRKDANPGQGWATVTLEQIMAWDPDVVFLISYWRNPQDVVRGLRSDPTWNQLRAMKTQKVYAFAGDLYSWDQPSPRWVLGLIWMAKKIYPESFADVDIMAVAEDFYRVAYGLNSSFFLKKIRNAFQGDLH